MAKDFGGMGGRQPPRDAVVATATPDALVATAQNDGVNAGVDGDSLIPELPRARGLGAESMRSPLDGAGAFRPTAQPSGQPSGENRSSLGDETRDLRENGTGEENRGFSIAGLSLPTSILEVSPARRLWFAISILVPVVLGALYLFLMAPDQYVTEYRFSVRVPVGQPGSLAQGGSSLSALFGGNPTPGTDLLDNYTVADYSNSAQAAADLDAKINLRDIFNKPLDPFSRVGSKASAERLAKYYNSMVYSDYDASSGLVVVRVKAYSAEDSYKIATSLFGLSADLVNSIGQNSQADSVRFAHAQVDKATAKIADLRAKLAGLRRNTGIVSPNDGPQDIISGNETLINNLVARDVQIKGQMALVMAQLHNPNAPQMAALRQQLSANSAQLATARKTVSAGASGLANTVGQFEDIQTQLTNAQNVLTSANQNYALAQAGADAQRLYLTAYVKPRLPESPVEPNRWYGLLLVVMVSGMVWIVGRLIGNSILEHT